MEAGTTTAEKYIYKRSQQSFLSYWSVANPFRPGRPPKEICDVLVSCGNLVFIISSKDIAFGSQPIEVAWPRWKKRAIDGSIRQLLGAQRYLTGNTRDIFLNADLNSRWHINLAKPEEMKIFLIAVANGSGNACSRYFNNEMGSLIIAKASNKELDPFEIGEFNPTGSFIHVLDDLTFDLILNEFDAISDLAAYLEDKEKTIRSFNNITFHGEEVLAALHLRGFDSSKQKYSIEKAMGTIDDKNDILIYEGNIWSELLKNERYIRRKDENAISYFWDNLIEHFSRNSFFPPTLNHKQRFEEIIRTMALEPRVQRRAISKIFIDAVETFPNDKTLGVRTSLPQENWRGTHGYFLMQLAIPKPEWKVTPANYFIARRELLKLYCGNALARNPALTRIIGFSSEPMKASEFSLPLEAAILDRKDASSEYLTECLEALKRFGHGEAQTYQALSVKDFPE